jgi:hypothetical protein
MITGVKNIKLQISFFFIKYDIFFLTNQVPKMYLTERLIHNGSDVWIKLKRKRSYHLHSTV